ncbi:MAG: UDP-N-acetylglucosamine 2-epimerase [Streptococcaceae bacterium]|jgi:GDP/UDP-N,N'-diacetylbacillosamine 2-epimerase (hydrolysing)|nr:UDP-N-acetylglucosamine 2-epimerase [Streptococcaceae bacterium]
MKKNICVLTATRAEYGLLKPVIEKLQQENSFDVSIVVTGMHLSPEFGLTYKEIEEDGLKIDKKIEILLSSDTPASISKSMGLAMISFADYFEELQPDGLIVLGDRYETLAVCCVAMNARIPIFHLYGGEATEGIIDESIRHCITKMSYLHFTATEKYREKVIQLGESPDRVFNVGATGVENILKRNLLFKKDLERSLNYSLTENYAIVTFHSVTLEDNSAEIQIQELLKALDQFSNMQFIITKANADADGRVINEYLEQYGQVHKNVIVVDSLGTQRYLSAVKYAKTVIGNSSSGIVEVPSFGVPTVNIGDRQKGRIQADSVINCKPLSQDIIKVINKALSDDFINVAKQAKNPYEGLNTSSQIVKHIKDFVINDKIDIKKKFYDLRTC